MFPVSRQTLQHAFSSPALLLVLPSAMPGFGFLLLVWAPAITALLLWDVVQSVREPARTSRRWRAAGLFLSALLTSGGHAWMARDNAQLAQAAAARIEQFAHTHGRWPTSLQETGSATRPTLSFLVSSRGRPELKSYSTFVFGAWQVYDFRRRTWYFVVS